MGISFRALRAEEVECRIGQIARNGSGLSLLLFKTARTDMDILDETVGPDNWQCKFYECKGTLFCSTGIRLERDDGSCEWVWKDDAGSPSDMEAAKGEASDCRKRSGVCWGIGRELYTAPRIWVYSDKCTMKQLQNGRYQCFDSFSVSSITIEDHRIEQLEIVNDGTGQVVFQWTSPAFVQKAMEEANAAPSKEQLFELTELVTKIAEAKNVTNDVVLKGLRESSPMRAVGMRDNRVETAAQAEAGINQLKIWLETVERSK